MIRTPTFKDKLIFLLVIIGLSGCGSEVDKCVDAQVKGWKAEQERVALEIKTGQREPSTASTDIGRILELAQGKAILDSRTPSEVAAAARLKCMNAAGSPR